MAGLPRSLSSAFVIRPSPECRSVSHTVGPGTSPRPRWSGAIPRGPAGQAGWRVWEAIMGSDQAPAGSGPRIGLVLGAGGVLGAAWMTGALPAVQDRLPCPLNDAEVIVGTSAGSVIAAALRCGSSIDEMIAHQRGEAAGVLRNIAVSAIEDGPLPPWPQLRLGSPPLMLASLLKPHRVHPAVGASAWLLRGRGQHAGLRAMLHALHHSRQHAGAQQGSLPHWVDRPTWIVAVDYDSGQRVVFGRADAPPDRRGGRRRGLRARPDGQRRVRQPAQAARAAGTAAALASHPRALAGCPRAALPRHQGHRDHARTSGPGRDGGQPHGPAAPPGGTGNLAAHLGRCAQPGKPPAQGRLTVLSPDGYAAR